MKIAASILALSAGSSASATESIAEMLGTRFGAGMGGVGGPGLLQGGGIGGMLSRRREP